MGPHARLRTLSPTSQPPPLSQWPWSSWRRTRRALHSQVREGGPWRRRKLRRRRRRLRFFRRDPWAMPSPMRSYPTTRCCLQRRRVHPSQCVPMLDEATQHCSPPLETSCSTTQCDVCRAQARMSEQDAAAATSTESLPDNWRLHILETVGVQTSQIIGANFLTTQVHVTDDHQNQIGHRTITKIIDLDDCKSIDVIFPPIRSQGSGTLEKLSVESWTIYPTTSDIGDDDSETTTNVDIESIDVDTLKLNWQDSASVKNRLNNYKQNQSLSTVNGQYSNERTSCRVPDEWCGACHQHTKPEASIFTLTKNCQLTKWIGSMFGFMGFKSSDT